MYVCLCHGITDRQLTEAAFGVIADCRLESPLSFAERVADRLGVGMGCGSCREFAVGLLEEVIAGRTGTALPLTDPTPSPADSIDRPQ